MEHPIRTEDAAALMPRAIAHCHADQNADAQSYCDSNERTLFGFL
jgi:hypothetical protein